MKRSGKVVSLCATLAGFVVLAPAILHFRSVVAILRLVIAFVFLYGGLTLLGVAVERAWAVTLRVAKRRRVKYPRTATVVSLIFTLLLNEFLLMVAVKMHVGGMIASYIAGVFLLIGGSVVVGRWLSAGWDIANKVFSKNRLAGDDI